MDQIRIAADSSCDLLTMDGVDFVSVPLTVRTATEEFRDDAALDVDAMVTTLRGTKGRTQVVRYINARLAPLGEPELTGSMVSNYVKQKLVPAPQKKLYTAEHLARLLFIAVVKPVVPLEGLRLMFSIQEECYPLQTAYDYFCDEFENMLGAAFGVAPAVEGLGETESDAKDLLRSTISATVNKVCLDRYLEEYRKRREQAETIAEKEISLL